MEESAGNLLGSPVEVVVEEVDDGVIGIGGVGIGSLVGSSPAHFLFAPTVILVAAGVVLIINTQSDTADKSSIQGSSNERNLIVKSTAKFNFARLICLLIRGGSSSSLVIAVFDGGVSPGANAPTLSTHILTDFWFVVVWSIPPPLFS